MYEIVQNRNVLFGEGGINEVKGIVSSIHARKVFALTYSLGSKALNQIMIDLESSGIDVYACDLVKNEPDLYSIDQAVVLLKEQNCDCVLAVGGGSVMDAAKAVAMIATNGGNIEDYQMNDRLIMHPTLPLILIPTTAGTGSEATKVSVIYNNNNHLKKSIYSPYMIAETIILDPSVTSDLPARVTASTGIDALSHAIESYVSLNATPYTEMHSLKALELINKSLVTAVRDGKNMQARADMLYASYFAGCALHAGIGLAHIIAQPIGGLLKIPHGDACSIFLPHSMEYNKEYCIKKYCDISRILGSSSSSDDLTNVVYAIDRVKALIGDVEAPTSINSYIKNSNFDLEEAVDIIQGATSHIKCNPRPVSTEIIKMIIQKVL